MVCRTRYSRTSTSSAESSSPHEGPWKTNLGVGPVEWPAHTIRTGAQVAVPVHNITTDQVARILATDEGHFSDLKGIAIAPAKLSRTVTAFANASGGELLVGIDESDVGAAKVRTWRGFDDVEAANAHLQVFEQLLPLGQYYSYGFLKSHAVPGLVLQVGVNKTREITKASDVIPYLRRGAQNLPITTQEGLDRLRFDKGV